MKGFLTLLVLAAAGYFGYTYYTDNKVEIDQRGSAVINGEGTSGAEPERESTSTLPAAPAAPEFESRIGGPGTATGEKEFAPPGIFYVVERVSVMTSNGVKALSPGEEVRLLQRIGKGRMKVTAGKDDFEVKESQVTNDLDLAREAEKREFVARGGKL
jgi:hypothetical protein